MTSNNQAKEEPISIRIPGLIGIIFALASMLLLCISAYIFIEDMDVHGKIESMYVEHNVYDAQNIKGMRIHIRFTVSNKKEERCSVIAYYYYANGSPLKDFNHKYNTIGGYVSVSEDFIPPYEDTLYEDFTLFIPYDELHMIPGESDLMFNVSLYNYQTDKLFVTSEGQKFHFSLSQGALPITSSTAIVPTQDLILIMPTATQQSYGPVMVQVSQRTIDTSDGLIIYKDIQFLDLDGDAMKVEYIRKRDPAVYIEVVNDVINALPDQQIKGAVVVAMWTCGYGHQKYDFVLEATIVDRVGNRSQPFDLEFRCE